MHTTRKSRIPRFLAIFASIMFVSGIGLHHAQPAQAATYWAYPNYQWSASGATSRTNGVARANTYLCGLFICADWSNSYAQALRLSGAKVNRARVKPALSFSGTGINVTISASGLSAGFVDAGTTCVGDVWTGATNRDYVSVSFGSQNLCHAAAVVLYGGKYAVTGGIRVGSAWQSRTATANV